MCLFGCVIYNNSINREKCLNPNRINQTFNLIFSGRPIRWNLFDELPRMCVSSYCRIVSLNVKFIMLVKLNLEIVQQFKYNFEKKKKKWARPILAQKKSHFTLAISEFHVPTFSLLLFNVDLITRSRFMLHYNIN